MNAEPGTVVEKTDRYGDAFYRAYCGGCGRLVERRTEAEAQSIAEDGCGSCDYDGGDGE